MDILQKHFEHMEELERRREEELPATKYLIEQFEKVLRDETVLTDRMANAVFKNHRVLRNARLKERARRKYRTGDKTLDPDHLIEDNERYDAIQNEKKEHNNYLRRLKGKSGSKLSLEEQLSIRDWIREKQKWVAEVESDQEYIQYVFAAQPIINEYESELVRTQEYMKEDSSHAEAVAIEAAKKRRCLQAPAPEPLAIESSGTTTTITRTQESASVNGALVKKHVPTSSGTIDSYIIQSDVFTRMDELQRQYCDLIGIEPPHTNPRARNVVQWDICDTCNIEMIAMEKEGAQSCPQCANSVMMVDMTFRAVPFSHPINAPKSRGSYEKLSYMEKWMRMVSGEMNSEIPDEDWGTIYQEAINRRWSVVDRPMVRKLLKDLGFVKYYDLTHMITNELNGVPLVKFTNEEKKTLIAMFHEANELFDKCPYEVKRRSSFISYPYFFYQACKLAGYEQCLDAFPLLSGTAHKKHHDQIWKWICENKTTEPKWTFHPTV